MGFMSFFDLVKGLIDATDFSKAFGINSNIFIFIVLSSLLVGFVCLSFYYRIYNKQKEWGQLDVIDKFSLAGVIGFLSILTSLFLVAFIELIFAKQTSQNESLSQTIGQLKYFMPFVYFYFLTAHFEKISGLDFIRKSVWMSLFITSIASIILLVWLAIRAKLYLEGVILIGCSLGVMAIFAKAHKKF